MKLTSENVRNLFMSMLYNLGDDVSGATIIEGINSKYGLNPEILKEKEGDILSMLAQLPEQFHKETGGGWTFLNMCNDIDGNQWTDMHPICEQLMVMGMGIGKVSYLMPREMWSMYPGAMPYIQISI